MSNEFILDASRAKKPFLEKHKAFEEEGEIHRVDSVWALYIAAADARIKEEAINFALKHSLIEHIWANMQKFETP